jgi:hypothetical protein
LIRHWIWSLLAPIFRAVSGSPISKAIVIGIAIVLVLGIFAHLLFGGSVPGASDGPWRRRGGAGDETDAWTLAQRFAAEGQYTEAAHALYTALLARVSSRVSLRLHPSKTAGDYARDLRGSAPSLFGPFREFARSYEVVIYGLGFCDQQRFQKLSQLAGRIDPELGQLA